MDVFKGILFLVAWLSFEQVSAMGSRRPPPPPPPPPTPYEGTIWFTSNVATPDMLSLFTEPHLWPKGRERVNGFKVYGQQLLADEPSECQMCGQNIMPNLKSAGFFERLSEWGKELAVEIGSVKPGDCDSENNIASAGRILERVKAAGGSVQHISLDEPFVSGKEWCSQTAETTADHVKKYFERVYAKNREVNPEGELKIGLIEAYPHFSADEVVWFLQLLKERNVVPTHFHVDFDFWLARNKKMSDAQVGNDLRKMQAKCRELGIPFGILLWGHDGDNAGKFSQDVVDLTVKVRNNFGRPDAVVIQSWAQGSSTEQDVRTTPPNLTESNPSSLTGTLQKVLGIL